MEISWALISNYPNHLNLRNYSISQSINRGLGEGINQSSLERKVMLVVYLQKSWSSITQSPLVVEESLFQALGYTLISFTIVNKENSSSNFVLSLFHVSWFDEYFD